MPDLFLCLLKQVCGWPWAAPASLREMKSRIACIFLDAFIPLDLRERECTAMGPCRLEEFWGHEQTVFTCRAVLLFSFILWTLEVTPRIWRVLGKYSPTHWALRTLSFEEQTLVKFWLNTCTSCHLRVVTESWQRVCGIQTGPLLSNALSYVKQNSVFATEMTF